MYGILPYILYMNKQNLIVFPSGCYGTFFEWIFNFLEDPTMELPFNDDGSSHKFVGSFLWPKEKLFQHISSGNKHRFNRMHFGVYEEINRFDSCHSDQYHNVLAKELDFLSAHFDKIMVLGFDQESVLWQEHNGFDKVILTDESFRDEMEIYGYTKEGFKSFFAIDPADRIRHLIDREVKLELSPFKVTNLMGWHKNNIYDFDTWELRELLSFYWFTRTAGTIDAWEKIKLLHQDVLFVSITDIKNNFIDTVTKSAQHFDVPVRDGMIDRLQEVYEKWLPLQKQINKDSICRQVVESLLDKIPFDWSHCNLSILDEAWIQKALRDNHVEIRCHNLNVFPTNTEDFLPLLETNNEHWTEPENTVSSRTSP